MFSISHPGSNTYKAELTPIRYASRAFNPVDSHWDTVHQELFAIKKALDNCSYYILGCRIKVVTDIKENSHQFDMLLLLSILLSLLGTLFIRNSLPSNRLQITAVPMFLLSHQSSKT